MQRDISKEYVKLDDTDGSVELYENGKVIECGCGHKIGLDCEKSAVKCRGCSRVIIDEMAGEREMPEEKAQTKLTSW